MWRFRARVAIPIDKTLAGPGTLLPPHGVGPNLSERRTERMLQLCMEILQECAIVQAAWLSPGYSWDLEDALRISLAPMNHEDLMRLWDGFDLPDQLSVPCLMRTVRLGARERDALPVTRRTFAVGSRLSP